MKCHKGSCVPAAMTVAGRAGEGASRERGSTASPVPRAIALAFRVCALLALLAACAPRASAQFPRVSAGFGYGAGALYSDEYVLSVRKASSIGHFSSGLYAFDLNYVTRSSLTFGFRAHMMRVELKGEEEEVGRLDLIPAMIFVGYRKPAMVGHVRGFFGAGVGVASAHFVPAETIDAWQPVPGETSIDVSDERPFAFSIFGGTDVGLSENFSLELQVESTYINAELGYDPVPYEGFASESGYQVKARHVAFSLGLRWWVELW